jgi:alkylation response protein AidB-like acyl-CoA dehydrogenase
MFKKVFTQLKFSKVTKRHLNVFKNSELLTDEQKTIQDTAYDFAQNELFPYAAEWDAKKYFPKEVYKKAAEIGFAGKDGFKNSHIRE